MLEFADTLVRLGIYRSRSEALRELMKAGMEKLEWMKEVTKASERLFEIEKEEGEIPIRLEGALKHLLEERERF